MYGSFVPPLSIPRARAVAAPYLGYNPVLTAAPYTELVHGTPIIDPDEHDLDFEENTGAIVLPNNTWNPNIQENYFGGTKRRRRRRTNKKTKRMKKTPKYCKNKKSK